MENKKVKSQFILSSSSIENLTEARQQRDRLKKNIQEAINLIEFHKDFLGEPFVRTRLINILKRQ